jgi:hypothetical protein
VAWMGWNLVPGNPPNSVSASEVNNTLAAVRHWDDIYLFALDNASQQPYWNLMADPPGQWSGWQPIASAPKITSLGAASWEGHLYVFGISSTHDVYFNVRNAGSFGNWKKISGTLASGAVGAGVVPMVGAATNHLYIFVTLVLGNKISWKRSASLGGISPSKWTEADLVPDGGTSDQAVVADVPLGGGDLTLARRGLDSRVYIMPEFTKNRKFNPVAKWQEAQPPLFTTQNVAIAPVDAGGSNFRIYARALDGSIYEKPSAGGAQWAKVPGATQTNGITACNYFDSATENGAFIFTRFSDNKIYCNRANYAA